LCGDYATLPESSEKQLKVWLLKQALSWSFWVGGVGDDNIKLIFIVVQELEAISNVDLDFGVLVTDSHAWKVLLGETDNSLWIT